MKLAEATKRIRLRVSEGKFSSGKVMTEDEKRYWAGEADVIDRTLPEFRLWKYVPPSLAFEKEITLDLGKREVRLLWLGRGNTAGDAITWVPDAKVLVTGDTVVFPAPYGFGSYYSEWPAVLQQMIEMNAAAIVPGHGPVMKDYAYFKELIALFNDLTRQVKQAVGEGLTLEQTQKKVTMAEWRKRLAGEHKQRKADFESYFVSPGVKRAYEEATGKMKEEGIE
ncbi:MAG TPA: MBL fold metallo-hydrolase [Terriglobales bacterium]|nr:MBL fold metallo-hydrolase [Terriglobales bacterium]